MQRTMEFSLQQFSRLEIGIAAACTAFVGLALVNTLSRSKRSRLLPPGPPQDPIIGNVRHFPANDQYTTFCEWAKTYGDIVYVQLPGVPVIIVNNLGLIQELLAKRANINSGRLFGYMFNDLMDWKWVLTTRQPGEDLHEMRKMLRQGLGPQVVESYDTLIDDCCKDLVLNLNGFQGDPILVLSNVMGRLAIQLAYGDQIWNTMGDELVRLNIEGFNILNKYSATFWLVDILPFLRFVSSWMPGASFQGVANYSRGVSEKIRAFAWKKLVELHQSGASDHSFGHGLLDTYGPLENARDTLGAFYLGAVDTTTNAVLNFFLAMFLFPEVAKKVHAEIAGYIGEDRLPLISDRSRLPYTEAAWKESLRWRQWIPTGLPHMSQKEQTINGYFIPKGTLIFGNVGFVFSDPSIWGDPEVFRPERFLLEHNSRANDLPNPNQLIFGFGTRICPGMHLADRTVLHMAITTLSLYEILPLEGKAVPHPDTIGYASAIVRHPIGLECRFVPRGQAARNLLSSIELDKRC